MEVEDPKTGDIVELIVIEDPTNVPTTEVDTPAVPDLPVTDIDPVIAPVVEPTVADIPEVTEPDTEETPEVKSEV